MAIFISFLTKQFCTDFAKHKQRRVHVGRRRDLPQHWRAHGLFQAVWRRVFGLPCGRVLQVQMKIKIKLEKVFLCCSDNNILCRTFDEWFLKDLQSEYKAHPHPTFSDLMVCLFCFCFLLLLQFIFIFPIQNWYGLVCGCILRHDYNG